MAKAIMVQGTMSNAGKSLICAGLCRIFLQDGYKVAPFKSQNMALNSFITDDGLEMGRAQVVQAQAAGKKPSVLMNPILLKPTGNMSSQLIVMGKECGTMSAFEYYKMKQSLVGEIVNAYETLSRENDIIVIEGAGSPAEINLKKSDFVNMGMAKIARAPVLLVGDIDRGGVFAQLYGTIALLEKNEREIVKAMIINKFRGDESLLKPGLSEIEALTSKPVAGVVPMMNVDIEDEDSLSSRLSPDAAPAAIDIAIIRLPMISNFTDFMALEALDNVSVRYVDSAKDIKDPDLIIIPGSKNTIQDLKKIRETGIESIIKKKAAEGVPIIGICGGYQMLGSKISDPHNAEGGGSIEGIGLLPVETYFEKNKHTMQSRGRIINSGFFEELNDKAVSGYEIHMGTTERNKGALPFIRFEDGREDGCIKENICGTYLHGVLDSSEVLSIILNTIAEKKGVDLMNISFNLNEYREQQYNMLADTLREHLNMNMIYEIIEKGI